MQQLEKLLRSKFHSISKRFKRQTDGEMSPTLGLLTTEQILSYKHFRITFIWLKTAFRNSDRDRDRDCHCDRDRDRRVQ
jgi:hypothetical protein